MCIISGHRIVSEKEAVEDKSTSWENLNLLSSIAFASGLLEKSDVECTVLLSDPIGCVLAELHESLDGRKPDEVDRGVTSGVTCLKENKTASKYECLRGST